MNQLIETNVKNSKFVRSRRSRQKDKPDFGIPTLCGHLDLHNVAIVYKKDILYRENIPVRSEKTWKWSGGEVIGGQKVERICWIYTTQMYNCEEFFSDLQETKGGPKSNLINSDSDKTLSFLTSMKNQKLLSRYQFLAKRQNPAALTQI